MREMKDSGVEWIGEIPSEWNINRVKRAFTRKNEKAMQDEPVILSLARSGVRVRDVSANEGQVAESYYNYNPVDIDDLLLNPMDLYSGANCSISKVIGVISPAYMNLRYKENICPTFYDYYFKLQYWMMAFFAYGKGVSYENRWTLTAETLMNYPIVSLPYAEQCVRADYLDDKCAKIDAIIAREQAVIEKLKAYKLSVITEAVTKGLNPDVPMKDSGIEWIGMIPKSWNVIISRFVIDKIGDIDHYMPDSIDLGIPYVMTGDLQEKASAINYDICKQISENDYYTLAKKMKPVVGDIIFARYATIGTVCYVDVEKKFLVSYSCVTIRPNAESLNGKYLYHYFKSTAFIEEINKYINSNTQGNVGIESLYKAKLVIPSIKEQQEIASYLDERCTQIDSIIVKKQAVINKLTEYKKYLIYEVVTGKKEV